MKVLAAVVVAPHWLVAGGANAALRLSAALSKICDIDLARMSVADATATHSGLTVFDLRCSNPLAAVRRVLPRSLFTLFYRARIPDLVRSGRYNLVHIHNPVPALEMKRVARACLDINVPYVVSTHGIVELSSGGDSLGVGGVRRLAWQPFVDAPFRFVLRHAAGVMALSPADLPILAGFGCGPERVSVVPNGVHVPEAGSDPRHLQQVCAKFGLPFPKPSGVPVGIFLANHTKNKGVTVLLDAFDNYAGSFRLIVAGSQRDYVDYAKYSRVRQPGRQFHFPGFLADQEAAALFDYADLFVFPTLADTFPLVVLEAMAHGLPVLATRVGGIPHQVPESCGCLVEPGSPAALIEGFERLTGDMGRLAAMGRAARRHVAQSFSWDRSAASALSFYRSILAATSPIPQRSATPAG